MSERKVKERHGQVRRQPWRLWAFAVIVVAVLGTAVWLLKPAPRPTAPAATEANAGGSRVISIEADMAGFSTKVIRAKVGEPLTVQLTSLDNRFHTDGGGRHQFAIDELNVNIIAPPEGTATATFTPTKPGVYEFYCDICCGGRANPTMQGQLIVEG